MSKKNKYINREISWLDFNLRVLQEAADESVPLLERLRFIGIFSNNLDEFFQVRYSSVQRIAQSEKSGKKVFGGSNASDLLKEITKKVINQQNKSVEILSEIQKELERENIIFINENQVLDEQVEFLSEYFIKKVSPALVTVILSDKFNQDFSNNTAFLAVRLELNDNNQFALIEIPKDLDRFVVLPKQNGKQYIMILDDLIRYNFQMIFNFFDYTKIESHMIKVTRNAELDMEGDLSKSYINKIIESVNDRILAEPVRLVYDSNISDETLQVIKKKLLIDSTDGLIPGGRYHHRRDYMNFPRLNRGDLQYEKIEPLSIKGLSLKSSIFKALDSRDHLINTPYHSFSYIIKFLRESALDPDVRTIKITLYRLSKISNVISSLINAAKNGKKVIVQIELQARFDETNNINYAKQLQTAGVNLIFGIPGLKVHSKICVIEKNIESGTKRYGFVSTGNFNEDTATLYTDYSLFTADQKILKEVNRVFNFLQVNYKLKKYNHLIVSPHYTKNKLIKLIDNEIYNKKNNLPSGIRLKLNAITNFDIIDKLYEASCQGVSIKMIVRGICCLIPGVEKMSKNIEVISVIDKFLEHSRVYIFENNGDQKIYISSADFMTRNIENRVEVATPIYDSYIKNQILDTFEISWNDNIKSRLVNQLRLNKSRKSKKNNNRSQWMNYDYFKSIS
jgi:polyphosphate kinase